MATRVRELAAVVSRGVRRRRVADLVRGRGQRRPEGRIAALPGFGEMKIKSLSAVLAKQFGVAAAEGLAPDPPHARRRHLARGARALPAVEARLQEGVERCLSRPSSSGSVRTTHLSAAAGRGVGHLAVRRRASCRARSSRRSLPRRRVTAPAESTAAAASVESSGTLWRTTATGCVDSARRGRPALPCGRDAATRASTSTSSIFPTSSPASSARCLITVQRAVVRDRRRSATCTSAAGATAASTCTSGSWRAPHACRKLIGSFAAIWDDVLPPLPEDVWRANLDASSRARLDVAATRFESVSAGRGGRRSSAGRRSRSSGRRRAAPSRSA